MRSAQIAAICAGDLPRVSEWLKFPGISAAGKQAMSSALAFLALQHPETREDVIGMIESTLELMLASQPADNVLDTMTITCIVGDLMDLRAVELSPLIERLWEKRYIQRSIVGDLTAILGELESPPEKAKSKPGDHSMIARYRTFRKRDEETSPGFPADDFGLLGNDHGRSDPADLPRAIGATRRGGGFQPPCLIKTGRGACGWKPLPRFHKS